MHTPVVLIVFNRPSLTARVLARIRAARPPRLLVVADGPRSGHPTDTVRCAEVRAVIDGGVDWPCVVEKNYSDANLGCGRRVASGLDWVFTLVEEAIILEDDCLPDPSFFPFCEELLERYRDDARVAQIAGCSFQGSVGESASTSYYFSRYPHCWGWATWRRAWQYYDHEMTAWRAGAANCDWLSRRVEHVAERKWWAANFDATFEGRIDTWDFRWTVTIFRNQWLSVLPYRNLVSNIGFGPGATHTTETVSEVSGIPIIPMSFPLSHPTSHNVDERADRYSSETMFRSVGLWQRCRRRASRLRKTLMWRKTG